MIATIRTLRYTRLPTQFRCFSSSSIQYGLSQVPTIQQSLNTIDLAEFRENAFVPEKPLLIRNGTKSEHALPAADRWFQTLPSAGSSSGGRQQINTSYLSQFSSTILPYEYYNTAPAQKLKHVANNAARKPSVLHFLDQLMLDAPNSAFQRFNAPLSIFLSALTLPASIRPKLYIAQAQLVDLPEELQDDLPTPYLVRNAGKGDIYDANIWIGIPPTYTPLHRDPNPNLFVQLCSRKQVRLFSPSVGLSIFREVQGRVGQNGSSSFRGYEMMEGAEREELERAVWGEDVGWDGLEGTLEKGEALFIPKGWWHSVRSEGEDVNASVNWWFR